MSDLEQKDVKAQLAAIRSSGFIGGSVEELEHNSSMGIPSWLRPRKLATKQPVDDPTGSMAYVRRKLVDGSIIGLAALCVYFVLALGTYDAADPGWSYTGSGHAVTTNLVGSSGAWIADVLFFILGYLAFVVPVLLATQAWLVTKRRNADGEEFDWAIFGFRGFCFLLTLCSAAGLATLHFYESGMALREGSGGVLGKLSPEIWSRHSAMWARH